MKRQIIEIDENLCDGCGVCIPNCHEGALQIIDGKARLISELFCDGLGACIGHCPTGAIKILEKEAEAFDEIEVIRNIAAKGKNTVIAHLKHLREHNEERYLKQALQFLKEHENFYPFTVSEIQEELHTEPVSASENVCACAGSAEQVFAVHPQEFRTDIPLQRSALTHWPVQMHLIQAESDIFRNADLLLAADCVAFTSAHFHQKYLPGKKLIIACPKLDQSQEQYLAKLIRLIDIAKIRTLEVLMMEVPCCRALLSLAQEAIERSSRNIPLRAMIIDLRGNEIHREDIYCK
jgi:ferredoxin